jgi:hypothetical protein
VKPRGLVVAWVLVPIVFVILVLVEFGKWRSLTTEGARAARERQQLSAQIQLNEQQLMSEMRKHSELLKEMQWTSSGGDPSGFLARIAELAKERRIKITAIGPLERQTTPQFSKSWHTIQLQGPYRDIRELAARVEQEKGILEDVHLEAAPTPAGSPSNPAAPADEVQARFKLTALELTAQAKAITERTLAASRNSPQDSTVLPVPTRAGPITRDPFAFVMPVTARAPAAPSAPASERPRPPVEVKGIVSFPGGFLAIINNQIVKVGDTVSGYRVERITESSVTLRQPGESPQTIGLPDVSPAAPEATNPPAAPKR